jgi:uncharacterized protein YlxW (UPF0749 family)
MTDKPTMGAPARRPDASMSLLTDVLFNPLDPGYAQAAARRAHADADADKNSSPTEPRRRRGLWLGVCLAALGVLVATAAAQVRDRAPSVARANQELLEEIDQRTAATSQLEDDVTALQREVDRARVNGLRLTSIGREAAAGLDEVERAAGVTPVEGPGISVTVDDAELDDPGPGSTSAETNELGRVLDRDLQLVVNGLWAAGAEAVAVNGQRLSSLSAIRNAGDAILVDFRPLSPPYSVLAVGDPATLRTGFLDGSAGRMLRLYSETYKIRYDVQDETDISLSGVSSTTLRYAKAGSAL